MKNKHSIPTWGIWALTIAIVVVILQGCANYQKPHEPVKMYDFRNGVFFEVSPK